ncbi:MAG: AzlD domain-containing protein [Ilumatobacter sp.]|uniref:AzlD domain-containing protein n=1 Tax=Ilumatobacter sp. TaxID=1967498 RepID=UPI003C75FA7F
MSTGAALLVLAAASLGTYFARSSLVLLLADRTLPIGIERALTNVGPAVLAALTVNLAVGSDGLGSVEFAEAAAILVAAGVTVWRRNLIWTFVAGMVTLLVLAAIT